MNQGNSHPLRQTILFLLQNKPRTDEILVRRPQSEEKGQLQHNGALQKPKSPGYRSLPIRQREGHDFYRSPAVYRNTISVLLLPMSCVRQLTVPNNNNDNDNRVLGPWTWQSNIPDMEPWNTCVLHPLSVVPLNTWNTCVLHPLSVVPLNTCMPEVSLTQMLT